MEEKNYMLPDKAYNMLKWLGLIACKRLQRSTARRLRCGDGLRLKQW